MIWRVSVLALVGAVFSAGPVVAQGTEAADDADGLGAYLQGAISDLAGDVAHASSGYAAALSSDPDNLTLRQRVMELALINGDVPTAVRLAKTLPELEQNTISRVVLAVDAAHQGRIKDARKQMREAAKTAPGLLQFEVVGAYLDFADGVRAAKLAKRLEQMEVQPGMDGRRYFHIARLWLKSGDYARGLAALEKAQKMEPNAIFPTLLLGQVYVHQGMGDKAAALYDSYGAKNPAVGLMLPSGDDFVKRGAPAFASTLDEDLASALFDFGLLVWSQGVTGPARQLMNTALWLAPEDKYYRYYSGVLREMEGDYAAAEKDYEPLAGDGDMALGAKLRLAELEFKRGERAQGLREVRALVRQYPSRAIFKRSLAQLAFEDGDYAAAAEQYSDLMAMLPADAEKQAWEELLFARGAAYERDAQVKKAEQDLARALQLNPTNAQVMNYLGYMWVDRGENLEMAFDLLKKAHLLAPQDGAITDSVGWAYFKRGDYGTAVKYLEVATAQDPENPEVYDHLGDAYAKLGRRDDAVKYWRLTLELVGKGAETPREDFAEEVKDKLDEAGD